MEQDEWLADRFEEQRSHLRSVAYRMLGSFAEADDALQDAWLRVSRAGADDVENLGGWLTTIVARVCLNMLRSRNVRREESLDAHVPDPVVRIPGLPLPDDEALMADSVGLALLVVLDTLTPAERLAFVLHDMFDLRFEEIAAMVGKSPAATRQLASRARRRVKGTEAARLESDLERQRECVDAFFAAARGGNFDDLVAVLDPDVVLRIDASPNVAFGSMVLQGAAAVATQAGKGLKSWLARPGVDVRPAVVNGAAGVVIRVDDKPVTLMAFSVAAGRIVEIDSIADPERLDAISSALAADE